MTTTRQPVEGYIDGCRVSTEPPYWVIQGAGEYYMDGEYRQVKPFRKRLDQVIDKPKPNTWYHAYHFETITIFTTRILPHLRRLGSIYVRKQKWWEKLFGLVRVPTMIYQGSWHIFTDASKEIQKFAENNRRKI